MLISRIRTLTCLARESGHPVREKCWVPAWAGRGGGGSPVNRRETCSSPGVAAHQSDRVEFGLLARIHLGALACLVALVEQLDLLQFLERLAELRLGVVELGLEFVGRALEVL